MKYIHYQNRNCFRVFSKNKINHSTERQICSSSLVVERIKDDSRFASIPPKEELKFGSIFSDHMLMIEWNQISKWDTPRIVPYQNLSISPAASCLNYALGCFEGMKAYKSIFDESLLLFRPEKNMLRFQKSIDRLDMDCSFDYNELLVCMKELIKMDSKWVPYGEGYSLYIRPLMIGTCSSLKVSPPSKILLYVITSPVGPYYQNGFEPVRLTADVPFIRAWPGGSGDSKIGANYGPSLKASSHATAHGYDQVLWLFGAEDFITEVGTMNIFFLIRNEKTGKKELVTPPLTQGDILPGVTRLSIMELVQSWEQDDLKVTERAISMKEIKKLAQDGNLLEAFGSGTAAVVSPISCIQYQGEDIHIHATGTLTKKVWEEISSIQYGKVNHHWSVKI